MLNCVAMMVVQDKKTLDEQYVSVEMEIVDERLPRNNTNDIMRMVSICNNSYTGSEELEFIDMYGLIIEGKFEAWEVSNEV